MSDNRPRRNNPPVSDEQRQHNKEIRSEIGTYLQLEYKNNAWLVHADTDGIMTRYGVQAKHHILSRQDGFDLFNHLCEIQSCLPLDHPEGYMPLQNNVYAYLHQQYQITYENTMDGVMDGILDGTGCGLQAVLDTLDSAIRKDSHEFLPKEVNYGDLRYIAMNDDRKQTIDKYIDKRVMQTVTYEKSKGYEDSTKIRFKEQMNKCADAVRNSLCDEKQEELQL